MEIGPRGCVDITLDGKEYTLRYSFAVLNELRTKLGKSALEYVENSKFDERQYVKILGAGLRGGGHEVSEDQLLDMLVLPEVEYYNEVLSLALGGSTKKKGEEDYQTKDGSGKTSL